MAQKPKNTVAPHPLKFRLHGTVWKIESAANGDADFRALPSMANDNLARGRRPQGPIRRTGTAGIDRQKAEGLRGNLWLEARTAAHDARASPM